MFHEKGREKNNNMQLHHLESERLTNGFVNMSTEKINSMYCKKTIYFLMSSLDNTYKQKYVVHFLAHNDIDSLWVFNWLRFLYGSHVDPRIHPHRENTKFSKSFFCP